ncbi:putative phosphatase regulatory subunit-domain-containing protein [Mycena belliarum]|uniref:Phosphatase regulatory subunit-domain-containing protein n=1 Tax=Mycena belliarum TaxID=1033014 RepID=A0AAD6U6G2_9AGAR|nr:putative phosphatase regulatory subunit-domain-containing protein [Mycena belliae]
MLATLSMSPTMDFRDVNTAGAPLPLMPRRSSSSSNNRVHHHAAPAPPKASTSTLITPKTAGSPITLTVQHATPPDDAPESHESSSSSSDGRPTITLRIKRTRGVRPPEHSTPTPTPAAVFLARTHAPSPPELPADGDTTPRPAPRRPLFYTPGTGAAALRALSTSHLPTPPLPTPKSPPATPDDATPRMVRKKSGQPVKSSLKSSAPRTRGSLSVFIGGPGTGGTGPGNSKSAPSTPTGGARSRVHFDAQLEHVKLFLAEQRPIAVSRDGSPTEDTSGTEGELAEWPFGGALRAGGGAGTGAGAGAGRLEMAVDVPPPAGEVDVKLQRLTLGTDGASVHGEVAVRNLAFDKWVAVRFTLDAWQTTSEVTARYARSLPGGAVDVFAFSIRLADVLARIEGKEMLLAVRYTTAGREMWDSNGGANYRATFRRVREVVVNSKEAKVEEGRQEGRQEEGKGGEGEGEGGVAADLRSRLERVVKGQTGPGPVQLRAASKSAGADPASSERFKSGSLAARYDFHASARTPWRPATVHQRAASHPVLDSPSPGVGGIPWPTAPKHVVNKDKNRNKGPALGSPREAGEEGAAFRVSDNENNGEDLDARGATATARHHTRGYFDVPMRDTGGLRRTPPGTPRRVGAVDDLTPPGRAASFPPLGSPPAALDLALTLAPRTRTGVARELSSDGSTPSIGNSAGSTPSGSGSLSPVSPAGSYGFGFGSGGGGGGGGGYGAFGVPNQNQMEMEVQAGASPATYHSFLDKFCFYTGPETAVGIGIEGLPRTQSVSSVEEYLSTASATPRLHTFVSAQVQAQKGYQHQHQHQPAPRRAEDGHGRDGRGGSGEATPTPASRAATPVAA